MQAVTVERPSGSGVNKAYVVCPSDKAMPDSVVSVGTVECFSNPAAGLTEGRLSDAENQRAVIRVKIRPSVFIIETKEEYTMEEISTDSLNKLIKKRTAAFKANISESGNGTHLAKRRKICAGVEEGHRLMAEQSVAGLETVAELLPVVVNVTDWNIQNEEEIRFDLKGNEGMEELVNASHLDPEVWELDRLTALVLDGVMGVFYARYNIADIVVTRSHVTNLPLQHPVVFRLKHTKLWISTPLHLAIPVDTNLTFNKVLYQHPWLSKVDDLKAMAEKSKSVSSILIPGVSNFKPAELELLCRGGRMKHYFTAQCYFSKSDVSLADFVLKQHEKYDNNKTNNTAVTKESTAFDNEEERKKRADAVLAAFGTDLDTISSKVSKDYADWFGWEKNKAAAPSLVSRASNTTAATTTSVELAPVSFKRPVSCFFGPDFESITNCIADDSCGLQMHLFPCQNLLDLANRNRTFIVTPKNMIEEIHDSGRFMNITDNNSGFIPDVDIETLKFLLKTPSAAATVASILYYNNVNLVDNEWSITGTHSLAEVIVEFFPQRNNDAADDNSAEVVGEIASAVAALYNIGGDVDCEAILFPKEQLMVERRSYGRQYNWNDPIKCIIGLYRTAMDTRLANVRRGEPVPRDETTWAYMHMSVIQLVLSPLFDAVLRSGAWAITELRDFLRWILEETFLRYTTTPDQHNTLILRQPVLDSMARLCVSWAVMQSGAENCGLCVAFSAEPPFIIEPEISLENYALSDTPSILLSGENVVDRIRTSIGSHPSGPEQTSTVRLVPMDIPSGRFFKTGKDLTVLIVEPEAAVYSSRQQQQQIIPKERLSIEYTAPRILAEPSKQCAGYYSDGYLKAKLGGMLSAEYSVVDRHATKTNNGGLFANDELSTSEVDGVVTGLSIDGKMEHVNISLPGMKSTAPDELPVNATKHGKYLIKDKGLEAVFFEPLLSSLVLDTAANDKKVRFDSLKLFKECLAPLRTGKITIHPTTNQSADIETLTSSMSVAGPGFEWLWKVLQNKHGFNSTLKKNPPVAENNSRLGKYSLPVGNGGVSESILLTSVKHLTSSVSSRNNRSKTITGTGVKATSDATAEVTPVAAFNPSFVEIDTFLKQHLRNVLSTLVSRMAMIVSNAEVKIIKSVCENVAKIILDSFYVALDPEQAVVSILERITGEQNGIFLDAEGFGFGITRLSGANILSGRHQLSQQQIGAGVGGGATSTLEALLSQLNTLGAEGQMNKPTKQQQQHATSKQDVAQKIHAEQVMKVRDSSEFTARLVKLIRDDDRKKRINTMLSEAVKSQQRTPPYMISAMTKPAKPVFGSSRLPASEKPQGSNFSTAQYLYVPVNPKHILSHMQWLECMSVIEAATRDSAMAACHFEEAAEATEAALKELLAKWNDTVTQVTSDTSPAALSSLKLEWLNREATRISVIRDESERSRVALAVQGKLVNLENYGMIANARSLIDVDFYVKVPNFWQTEDWRELVYNAVAIASIPLQLNISKGIMAASQSSMLYSSSISLSSAEQTLRDTV